MLLCTVKVIKICYGKFKDDDINCLPLETFEWILNAGGGTYIKGTRVLVIPFVVKKQFCYLFGCPVSHGPQWKLCGTFKGTGSGCSKAG